MIQTVIVSSKLSPKCTLGTSDYRENQRRKPQRVSTLRLPASASQELSQRRTSRHLVSDLGQISVTNTMAASRVLITCAAKRTSPELVSLCMWTPIRNSGRAQEGWLFSAPWWLEGNGEPEAGFLYWHLHLDI